MSANSNRRRFLNRLAGLTLTLPLWRQEALSTILKKYDHLAPEECAVKEEFWRQIQQAFTVSSAIINLNNGGVSPQPRVVQEAVEHYNRLSNETPSYYMWRILDQGREPVRRKLADLAGCSPEEIAINRNASEALETVIFGLTLRAGDEVVLTRQDYPNMMNAWKQRAQREGIVLKWLSLELPSADQQYLIDTFVKAFTDKTRVVHITHLINWNGQVLPVRKIAEAAHTRGIEVIVDAAHSFAQLDYQITDLQADYLGTSLHKWLCAPFGSGMLYVRQEKIKDLYPLFAPADPESTDIRKFEALGTRSFAIEQGIAKAVDFHHLIGSARKHQRLLYLKNYWMERVKALPGVRLLTPFEADFSGAIGLFSVEGKTLQEINQILWGKYKIHTTSINHENLHGIRVTPNVYTLTEDLDILVKAIQECAG